MQCLKKRKYKQENTLTQIIVEQEQRQFDDFNFNQLSLFEKQLEDLKQRWKMLVKMTIPLLKKFLLYIKLRTWKLTLNSKARKRMVKAEF